MKQRFTSKKRQKKGNGVDDEISGKKKTLLTKKKKKETPLPAKGKEKARWERNVNNKSGKEKRQIKIKLGLNKLD